MQFLLLTILMSSILYINFRFFGRFGIDTLQAVGTNYWVCILTGLLFMGEVPNLQELLSFSWSPWALLLGFLFFFIFFLTGLATQKLGMTVASISTKLSLVVPVCVGFLITGFIDFPGWKLVLGILLSLVSIVLVSSEKEIDSHVRSMLSWLLPLVIFLGCGLTDTLSMVVQAEGVSEAQSGWFAWLAFAGAAVTGALAIGAIAIFKGIKPELKNVVGGILLGIPNYFSYYFLIKCLHQFGDANFMVFPLANLGVIVLNSLVAFTETIPKNSKCHQTVKHNNSEVG